MNEVFGKIEPSKPYCVYVISYSGSDMPPFYIGHCLLSSLFDHEKPYHGSVSSKEYGEIWHTTVKTNPELFRRKILSCHLTKKEAWLREKELQDHFRVHRSSIFVNMSSGGSKFFGGIRSKEHAEKVSLAHLGKKKTDEHRKNISEGRKGIVFSEETKRKMAAAHKGKKQSEEQVKKRASSNRGKTRSEETKEKMKKAWELRRQKMSNCSP